MPDDAKLYYEQQFLDVQQDRALRAAAKKGADWAIRLLDEQRSERNPEAR